MVVLTDNYMKRSEALAVPGAFWDRDARAWLVEENDLDDQGRRVLLRLFPHLRGEVPAPTFEKVRPVDLATPWAGERTVDQLLPNASDAITSVLRRYQAVDLGFCAARLKADGAAYVGWDRGLGKTLAAIALASELRAEAIMVVCPNSSKELVWVAEFNQWTPDTHTYNFGGNAKQRQRALDEWRERGGALLVHYEGLRLHEWSKEHIDLLIVDEAHRLQNGSASAKAPQFYKRLRKIKADHKVMLSGSVSVNSPEDIFGALHLMYPDRYRSKWRDWNNRFMHYVSTDHGDVLIGVKPEAAEAMRNELATFMVQRTKEDELPDLPERIDQTLYVDLSPSQRKVYDDLAERFVAGLPDGNVVLAPNVVSQLVKLRQVATGLDLLGENLTDSSKIDAAIDLVSDNAPNKTVIFCWHRATVDAIVARLTSAGHVALGIHGDVANKVRTERVGRFQTDPEVVAIVATLKTLGEAVQLHAATDVVFVEQSWIPSDMEQAADRVHRHGQRNRVSVTTLVARDTIDEYRILPTVEDKLSLRRMVLGR